jgi:hypothetical protein
MILRPTPEISAPTTPQISFAPCQTPTSSIRKHPSEVVHFEVITGGAF